MRLPDPFFEPLTLAAAGRSARHYARLRPRAQCAEYHLPTRALLARYSGVGTRPAETVPVTQHGPRALDSAERTPGQRTRAATSSCTSSDLQIVIDVTDPVLRH